MNLKTLAGGFDLGHTEYKQKGISSDGEKLSVQLTIILIMS